MYANNNNQPFQNPYRECPLNFAIVLSYHIAKEVELLDTSQNFTQHETDQGPRKLLLVTYTRNTENFVFAFPILVF